jgi:N-acetylglucosamine kinase-like BadF-type ATPase
MSDERKWFLGVDGGQSSTVAVIGDESGAVRGVGKGGPCNHVSTAEARERFLSAAGGAVRAAEEAAGCIGVRYEAACFGLSGGPHDKEALAMEIAPAHHYLMTTDAHVALTGATGGEPGIIAVAGTGSIAYGRNAAGQTARAGGWGYAIGDEGGAFDIVRQALRAALRFEEGWGPATHLRDVLLLATGARDTHDLVHRFYTQEYPKARIASYGPLVDETARQGDPVAREILMTSAQALATFVAAVRRQIFHRGEPVDVSYAGGVFGSHMLLERFRLIVELESEGRVHPPKLGPAAGALIDAYRLAGIHAHPHDSLGHLRGHKHAED